MRILHVTDSHGTVKSPEGRRDIYYITFLKKLYELGIICKKGGIDMVIHTGDLFHTPRVSNKFAGQVSEMIKAMGVPFYVVPGNHDIDGYSVDTIDQTMLGLLSKAGVIKLLDREHPITVTAKDNGEEYTVAISGQEYYVHIDEGNAADFEMQQDEADLNILAIHGYIADTPQNPNIKCTMAESIYSDADIILTGHYHRQFHWTDGQNLDIFNPGSMMRVEQTEYNKTHMPQYGILEIGVESDGAVSWDYNFYQFRVAQPSTTVFDYANKYKQKQASITLEGFKTSLANTMSSISPTSDILNIIGELCKNANESQEVLKFATDSYNDAVQNTPDDFEAPNGYIEAMSKKNIRSVALKHFQSHENTTMEFTDGLNIIVGESNNGKTAVMRGIMWVIDNYPLGTDFIMAGKNDVIVRITYDDGSYIERGRTRTDTGYYKIGTLDLHGQLYEQEFRGFTNAIPVEVTNLHQMPKVNITKDIETHLNVLSQLDRPFLITESPQAKAAAIGRITGTHVIDAAVKKNNSTIRNDKLLIKDINGDIEDLERKLKSLPDITLIEEVLRKYNIILAEAKAKEYIIKKCEQAIADIAKYDSDIATANAQLSRDSAIVPLKAIVDRTYKEFRDYSLMSSKVDEIKQLDIRIQLSQEAVETNAAQASMKGLVNYALGRHATIVKCTEWIAKKKLSEVEEMVNKKKRDFNMALYNATSRITDYVDAQSAMISQASSKLESISNVEDSIQYTEKQISSYKKQMQALKKQMAAVEKEKNQMVLKSGVCPCCGQPISEEHMSHINAYMEAKNG